MQSTQRYTDRVQDYVQFRPGYPTEIIPMLVQECGLAAEHVIADIGSGNGQLSRLFLDHGNHVFGVEPNDAMRSRADDIFKTNNHFTSVNGQAEATTLDRETADFIVVGQAFHWFDITRISKEFRRILKAKDCWVVLIWNDRKTDETAFQAAYEQVLISHAPDYKGIEGSRVSPNVMRLSLGVDELARYDFEGMRQMLPLEPFLGRVRSSSYCPLPDDPQHEKLMAECKGLFKMYSQNNLINMDYTTHVFVAKINNGLL